MNRSKRFAYNSILSLVQQIVTIICGLILPQLILKSYGSTVNGVMASITQFLSFITLLQGGVGTVARLAFYKPLAEKDDYKISVAFKTISDFYKKFSIIFVVYLLILSVIYPFIVQTGLGFWYVFSLTLILGLASVFEYFFGQASQMLLYSDQKNYVYSVIQIICTILSTVVGIILIQHGASVHAVKLFGAIVYAIRPLAQFGYVKRKYRIDPNVSVDRALLSQKGAALIRHIAFYIHTSTDVMVLSLLSNVLWVSVYSVHRYVVSSLSNLVTSVLGNTEVVYGDMIARNETETMKKQVPVYDLLSKIISCVCFFTCIILISRFVNLYTKGVEDVQYYHPLFAILLSTSELVYCMGLTYQNIYIAAGHIKKTEWIAVTEAIINLLLSIVLVRKFGIVGVAAGTLAAMIFKSIANIVYMKKNVFQFPIAFIVKSYTVNLILGVLLSVSFLTIWYFEINSYAHFFVISLLIFLIVTVSYVVVNTLFFYNEMQGVFLVLMKCIKRGKKFETMK